MSGLLAYASLMWDNALATYTGQAVHVVGLERSFVGKDTHRFGSTQDPCPKVALVPGNGCDAVLFRLPRTDRRHVLHNLRQREGTRPRVVRVRNGDGAPVRAKSFLPRGDEEAWTDKQQVIEALARARGVVGTGSEYVRTMVHAMNLWKIEDPLLEEIWEEVRS